MKEKAMDRDDLLLTDEELKCVLNQDYMTVGLFPGERRMLDAQARKLGWAIVGWLRSSYARSDGRSLTIDTSTGLLANHLARILTEAGIPEPAEPAETLRDCGG